MAGTTKTFLIVLSFAVLLATIATAIWLLLGSVVVASTGTLPGGWATVWTQIIAVLLGGIGLAVLLFWIAARKPKSLRAPD
jgi:hypothetical protein